MAVLLHAIAGALNCIDGEGSMGIMADEKMKLSTMLNYWMEHNKEHSREFREWADKARGFGETEVSEEILAAAREMDRADESLSRALKRLERKEP